MTVFRDQCSDRKDLAHGKSMELGAWSVEPEPEQSTERRRERASRDGREQRGRESDEDKL